MVTVFNSLNFQRIIYWEHRVHVSSWVGLGLGTWSRHDVSWVGAALQAYKQLFTSHWWEYISDMHYVCVETIWEKTGREIWTQQWPNLCVHMSKKGMRTVYSSVQCINISSLNAVVYIALPLTNAWYSDPLKCDVVHVAAKIFLDRLFKKGPKTLSVC